MESKRFRINEEIRLEAAKRRDDGSSEYIVFPEGSIVEVGNDVDHDNLGMLSLIQIVSLAVLQVPTDRRNLEEGEIILEPKVQAGMPKTEWSKISKDLITS